MIIFGDLNTTIRSGRKYENYPSNLNFKQESFRIKKHSKKRKPKIDNISDNYDDIGKNND